LPQFNRREWLALIAAAAGAPGTAFATDSLDTGQGASAPSPDAQPSPIQLVAQPGTAQLLEDGEPATAIWGYGGTAPGPTLRVRQGQRLRADLVNRLPQPTTVHWHGIRIDNEMDGVTGLTQPAVEPGDTFRYDFVVPDAGTYWYHPHNRTWEQLARGLYGALIVEEEKAPAVDRDEVLIFDDWRLQDDGAIHEESLGSLHAITHMGRLGNILTLNGQFTADVAVQAGERVRLRLINAANARIMGIVFEGHTPEVVALDGQPVGLPFTPRENMVVLAPAQRADLSLTTAGDPGSRHRILVDTGRERLHLGDIVYGSERAQSGFLAEPFALPGNPMPTELDLDNALDVPLVMEGGARGGFESAEYQGSVYGFRELALTHKKAWAFNGIAGMANEPLFGTSPGKTIRIKIENRTAWPHAMHFHGHHVREVSHSARDASPHWRDTVFVEPRQSVTVAFLAHNPGLWMLHCHMLEHQAGGMATWYEVL